MFMIATSNHRRSRNNDDNYRGGRFAGRHVVLKVPERRSQYRVHRSTISTYISYPTGMCNVCITEWEKSKDDRFVANITVYNKASEVAAKRELEKRSQYYGITLSIENTTFG
jgi:hypothetical protein